MSSLRREFFSSRQIFLFAISTFCVFAFLFLWLRVTAVRGIDRFGNPLLPDYAQFYVAGEMAQRGEIGQIYDARLVWRKINEVLKKGNEEGTSFFYPPFVPWLCVPLAWLPYEISAMIYLMFNIALGFGLGWSVGRHWLEADVAKLACWLFVASVPFWRCVLFGQNGLISLALLWAAYLAWKRNAFFGSGLLLAAGSYKPQIFVGAWIWLILWGPVRARLGLIAGVGMLFLLGSVAGVGLWSEWLGAIQNLHDTPESYQRMHSIHDAFQLCFQGQFAAVEKNMRIFIFLSWIIILWFLRFKYKNGREIEVSSMTAMVGWSLLTPRFYQYDLVIFFPVIVAFTGFLLQAKPPYGRPLLVAMPLSFYLSDFFAMGRIPLLTLLGLAGYCYLAYAIVTKKQSPLEMLHKKI